MSNFSSFVVSISNVIDVSIVLAATGLLLHALEEFCCRRTFRSHALFDWRIDRTIHREGSVLQWVLDRIFAQRAYLILTLARIGVPGAIISYFCTFLELPTFLVIILFLLTLIGGLRSRHGLDGSHHMFLVVLLASTIAKLMPWNIAITVMCVLYITAQLCLSYFISGVAKIAGGSWRSGEALSGIFSAAAYGSPLIYRQAERSKALALISCWAIILFEVVFPLVFFLPDGIGAAVAVAGMGFHGLLAVFMGLNKFVWAWWSAYPSLAWVLLS